MTQKFSGSSVMTIGKPDTQPGSLSEMGMIKNPKHRNQVVGLLVAPEATGDAIIIMSDKIRGSDIGPDPQRIVEMVNRIWSPKGRNR